MAPKKKRQYSRNGCKECKRRKLKCDEGKPECWQCSHLGKRCIYLKSIKFSDSRNVTVERQSQTRTRYNFINFSLQKTDASPASESPELSVSSGGDGGGGHEIASLSPYVPHISPIEDKDIIINEASTLANTIIESLDTNFDVFSMDFGIFPDYVKKQDILNSFDLPQPHKTHLEIFYDKISARLMPLEQGLCNEILLTNARKAPYLLAAMLSLATTGDEKLKYISTCLSNISNVFQDHSKILSNIEPLILTVLLLAADPTSNDWRAHLRGAKDLFVKYIKFYATPSLLLAKSWFAAIEILAGLQNAGTGKRHELNNLLDVGLYGSNGDLAVEVGILLPSGYNLFLGYSTEAIIMYREFIKLSHMDNGDILFQMSLIHSAKEFQVASDNILIPLDNPSHPDYSGNEPKNILPWSCYGFKENKVYSWFDLIHHLHVDALLLKLYNEHFSMDKTHPLCQNLMKGMLNMCFFYDDATNEIIDPLDSRLLMLQGPMLNCGLNCVDQDDKDLVEAYFKSLIDAGVLSANATFNKVRYAWTGVGVDNMEQLPFA
ncbi:Zn(II)2Cys6 transcription factor CYBJADRAFT_174540 [Cyberlindnera jadinii NRRL Y-1542]|uniref:Zn(2)-C6 fungal-type domain-containing protein n=1 Tax=Cyberlindnera jadinii (strain ATCC 18201 / CBS 1600 / BCRC 20928 / JCM 3617 / NBRC 0987 / NRRL Y-1542) TaxID=983966 RepID=A0A1E4RXT2_CYBJN|nr:hypothetical protein CYBJADRAFT_174540 [Cyberlindnera jadinii NRRL Y-1542]ODV71885.1 hypothetical protein CYBJADRAFT_174540 [Cyberlindnera jadinii NRRL Y-1542]